MADQVATEPAHGSPAHTRGWYKWYVAILLCAIHVVSFVDRFVMVLVTEPVRAAMHLSDMQLGLLQGSGFAILYCAFAIPLGWAADIANRRNLILAGMSMWTVATAASAYADSFASLFVARIFVGLGEACLIPAGMSLLAAYFSPTKLARGVAIFGMGGIVGHGIAFIGGGAVLAYLTTQGGLAIPGLPHLQPWQGAFLMAGVIAAPFLILVAGMREPPREGAKRSFREQVGSLKSSLGFIGQNFGGYGPFFISASAKTVMSYALASWSASIIVRQMGLAPAEAGMWVGVLGVLAGPIGSLSGGWILDMMTARQVNGAPLVFMAGGSVLCLAAAAGFCLATSLPVAAVSLFLFSVFTSSTMPALYSGVQMLTPDRYRGVAASINMMVYTFAGLGLGPTVVGFMSDRLKGVEGSLGYALLAAEAAMALTLILTAVFGRKAFQAKVLDVWKKPSR